MDRFQSLTLLQANMVQVQVQVTTIAHAGVPIWKVGVGGRWGRSARIVLNNSCHYKTGEHGQTPMDICRLHGEFLRKILKGICRTFLGKFSRRITKFERLSTPLSRHGFIWSMSGRGPMEAINRQSNRLCTSRKETLFSTEQEKLCLQHSTTKPHNAGHLQA